MRNWEVADYMKKGYYAYAKGRLGNLDKEAENWNESFAGDVDIDAFTF